MLYNKESYWIAVKEKITEMLLSVKIWMFLIPLTIKTIFTGVTLNEMVFMIQNTTDVTEKIEILDRMITLISTWGTFALTLVGTIVVVRETIKVARIKFTPKSNQTDET